jgi:hypothetical protein
MVTTGPLRYMDQLDAELRVEEWINDLRVYAPDEFIRMERFGLRLSDPSALPNGGVTAVWTSHRLAGIATVVRDEMNFSVLTIVDYVIG